LQPDERKILEVKYSKPQIKFINETELLLHTQALLLKIHVITGWKLTDDVIKLNILEDQFIQKLKEDYNNVNVDEIEYAFRKYGKLVKEWGKELSLSLIDEVMDEYLKHRNTVSELEERLLDGPTNDKPTDKEIESLNRETIESYYQDFLNGKQHSFKLLPPFAIAQLSLDGYCDFNLYEMFLEKSKEIIGKEILNEIDDLKLRRKNLLVTDKERELCELDNSTDRVIMLAKKMALLYFFNEAKKAGRLNIYVKEDE
jgi:hypothetical protein